MEFLATEWSGGGNVTMGAPSARERGCVRDAEDCHVVCVCVCNAPHIHFSLSAATAAASSGGSSSSGTSSPLKVVERAAEMK